MLMANIIEHYQLQDVVEIMKESLYDKYVDEHGVIDFARSGGMSQQKEAKRFLSALNKQSELDQKDCFTISVSFIYFSVCFIHFFLGLTGDILNQFQSVIMAYGIADIHLFTCLSGDIQFS